MFYKTYKFYYKQSIVHDSNWKAAMFRYLIAAVSFYVNICNCRIYIYHLNLQYLQVLQLCVQLYPWTEEELVVSTEVRADREAY